MRSLFFLVHCFVYCLFQLLGFVSIPLPIEEARRVDYEMVDLSGRASANGEVPVVTVSCIGICFQLTRFCSVMHEVPFTYFDPPPIPNGELGMQRF